MPAMKRKTKQGKKAMTDEATLALSFHLRHRAAIKDILQYAKDHTDCQCRRKHHCGKTIGDDDALCAVWSRVRWWAEQLEIPV